MKTITKINKVFDIIKLTNILEFHFDKSNKLYEICYKIKPNSRKRYDYNIYYSIKSKKIYYNRFSVEVGKDLHLIDEFKEILVSKLNFEVLWECYCFFSLFFYVLVLDKS